MNLKSVLAILLVAGCYGAAPGRPPNVPLPELADAPDAHVVVHSVTKTAIENVEKSASTCPQGHNPGDPACVVTRYRVAEPVTRTTTTASLNSEPITFAQFRVITDPKWNEKLGQIDDLSHKCHRANTPRYAGIGLMLGGIIAGVIVGGDAGKAVVWAGFGGGAASYALGYFAFGGSDCVAARRMYDQMDLSRAMAWTSVEGADYASEMHGLAEQFNSTHGLAAAAFEPPHESVRLEAKPPAKPVPGGRGAGKPPASRGLE